MHQPILFCLPCASVELKQECNSRQEEAVSIGMPLQAGAFVTLTLTYAFSINIIINSNLEREICHLRAGLMKHSSSCPFLNWYVFVQFTLPLGKQMLKLEQLRHLKQDRSDLSTNWSSLKHPKQITGVCGITNYSIWNTIAVFIDWEIHHI